MRLLPTLPLVFVLLAPNILAAAEFELHNHKFTLPEGFTIEVAAEPPLIERPIHADFDEQGRLYVIESNGSSEAVKIQAEKKPHHVTRLEDTDGDGKFDKRTVFAKDMRFPEGACWHQGSLYVGAPPEIWKLTDTDDDGVADQREVWIDGKTLTGCANDIHGPYVGPDGWLYWAKGAFAEQTYEQHGGKQLVTKAAHLFRRRPEGGLVENVMTGGMDNPVEIAFSPGGERFFTTTFLKHPRDGKRDGLIHAIYGGVYGKDWGAIDGHPRTGELMPNLVVMGAAAPCGFTRVETNQLGPDYQDNLLACLFNLQKITRHVLTPQGGTFSAETSDFLVSNNLDFHPTDVLEDADGSLIVVNTGGWYKLCCPTSRLYKPDILGAIYRIRRTGSHDVDDPRGKEIDFAKADSTDLVALLKDSRVAVRKQAQTALVALGDSAVPTLRKALLSDHRDQRLHAVWTLSRIAGEAAREANRRAFGDKDTVVRQAAIHSASIWRDKDAAPRLASLLTRESSQNQRAAAEALGRIGNEHAVVSLLAAAGRNEHRVVEHSIIYALLEIGDVTRTRTGLASANARTRRAALIALDQIEGGDLSAEEVASLLAAEDPVQDAAWWLVERHPEWAPHLVNHFREQFATELTEDEAALLSNRLANAIHADVVQQVVAESLSSSSLSETTTLTILRAITNGGLSEIPAAWNAPLATLLSHQQPSIVAATVSAVRSFSKATLDQRLIAELDQLARNDELAGQLRIEALATAVAARARHEKLKANNGLDDGLLTYVHQSLVVDQPVRVRSLAADVLETASLTTDQLTSTAAALPTTGVMELKRLLPVFDRSKSEPLGLSIIEALMDSESATALDPTTLQQQLAAYGETVAKAAGPLIAKLKQANADKIKQIDEVLALMDNADERRGQRIFHSTKTSCIACHQIGYIGGRIGPDLNRIGNIRKERDLLEAILFPSASFVRSYEPLTVVTTDGRIFNGVIRDENSTELLLALDAEKTAVIKQEDIEERLPGKTSIMPAGLEKHLSPQDLADLVHFLKVAR